MSDVLAIARGFRNAIDEDTMKALNVFSARPNIESCEWYVVTSDWMALAHALLTEYQEPPPTWRQDLAIVNKGLVAGLEELPTSGIVSNGSTPRSRHPQAWAQGSPFASDLERQKRQQRTASHLKGSCVFGKDFFLLGANAWLLCKEKFGYDHEIACPTVNNIRNNDPSPLLIRVPLEGNSEIHIPFPSTGRFAVGDALKALHKEQSPSKNVVVPEHAIASAEVAPRGINNVTFEPGNVSDDETDDLFSDEYMADDSMMDANPQQEDLITSDPILLLPPSTTSVSPPFIVDGEMNGHGLLTNDTLELKPHGTGLGNLGNTCFMNSTLQCLAHTDPIRRYFLSGDYVKDLNRDNPLGTRGELAVEFAALLGELWTTTASLNGSNHQDYSTRSSSTVVYPRTFKHTLGRHAEQFVGYNQHDSQELAIYLLDALHEDTNKVSTKPYVEKPEKEGEETDNEAASKAWELHLKRDNSRLLSFFMGQVKSCVQCCKPGCARVSTTFDPFMYLSVPIPGSCDKTLKVTFVPLDTNIRPQVFDVTVSKSGTFKDVYAKLVSDIRESSTFSSQPPILVENLCATDVWQKEIYKWYADDDAVDMVRESDVTFVYQLTELTEIKAMEAGAAVDLEHLNMSEWTPAPHHFKLDASTHIRLGRGNDWVDEFIKYLRDNNQSLNFQRAFNPKRGDSQDRADWYNKTHRLISLAYKWLADEVPDDAQMADDSPTTAHSPLPCIAKQCCASPWFVGVQSGHDLAVLTFCLEKMRENITELEQEESFPSGAVISVRIRKPALMFASKDIVAPFVLRIPSSLTVYGLRELLAKRLGRCLRTGRACTAAGSPTPQDHASDAADLASHGGFGPPELMVTCQVPLSFERIKTSSLNRPYGVPRSSQLGSLGSESTAEGKRPNTIAVKSDSAEAECVAGLVGNQGSVFMEWPDDLFEKHFDVAEYETIDELSGSDRERTKTGSAVTSVVDCIEKYCQMEQLEESEMWYCNRCQEHVQAWKKFDLYSSPPILIVHLKRFQYSAATHRRDKIGIYIDFPLVGLDLTGLVSHWDDGEEPIYDCYAVSNHFGGLGGGHYTAYCLNDDGSWAHYDDGRITTHVDAKEVVSAAAYCLYYRRRDLPWGGDFPISLRTPVLPTPVTMNDNWIPKIDVVPSAVVARVDEEDVMDVEDDDNASRTTSAMGSMDDHADRDHFDDIDDDGCPPLLTQ